MVKVQYVSIGYALKKKRKAHRLIGTTDEQQNVNFA